MFKQSSVARRLTVAFFAVIAVFLAVCVMALVSAARLTEADRWNKHTHNVPARSEGMMTGMVNMETGVRGFLLAGDARFLQPWEEGRKDDDGHWQTARRLTADNAAQHKRLDAMKALSDEFSQVAQGLIKARREVLAGSLSVDAFIGRFKQGKDKAAMDGFRSLLAEFDKAKRDLLATRAQDADDLRAANLAANRAGIIGGALLAIGLATGLGLWVARSILRQLGGEPNAAAGVVRAIAAQSNGISQVGNAVSPMDQVTQQNAALVEQSAAAAESLKQQARQMVEAVSFFQLAGGAPAAAARVPATAPAPVRAAAAPRAAAQARPAAAPADTQAWETF